MHINSKQRLGTQKIHFAEIGFGLHDLWHLGTQLCCDLQQDANTLTSFFAFQFADAIISLYHLLGLNKHGLTCSRLVVNDTADLTFVGGWYWQHQSPFAHGRCSIFVQYAFCLCLT